MSEASGLAAVPLINTTHSNILVPVGPGGTPDTGSCLPAEYLISDVTSNEPVVLGTEVEKYVKITAPVAPVGLI